MYPLMFGSQKIPVYCHMGNFGCGDGGGSLAMKIDGTKVCSCRYHSLQTLFKYLRAPACKNQTNSKFRGKGGKFDFFHILMSDRLGYN